MLAVVLFPFGVGPEPEMLRRIGAGIIWVAALLAALLSLDRLFAADHADGGLDLLALSPLPLEARGRWPNAPRTGSPPACRWRCSARFWRSSSISTRGRSPMLVLGLLIGTPALSLLGAIAAA